MRLLPWQPPIERVGGLSIPLRPVSRTRGRGASWVAMLACVVAGYVLGVAADASIAFVPSPATAASTSAPGERLHLKIASEWQSLGAPRPGDPRDLRSAAPAESTR